MSADLAVIVIARNEQERLAATLAALRGAFPDADMVVVDDASTDATPHIALQEGARVVRAPVRLGKGGAATLAARDVLQRNPQRVVLADGDLGESAAQLATLGEAGADMAVAVFSRRVGGGFGIALTAARRAIEKTTGRRLDAPLSGQRVLTAETLAAVLPFADGFGMETGMAIDALRAGFEIQEIELDLEHRATGRTAAGFLHRAKQLRDIARAYASRRHPITDYR
jgi:glycosyltransferase involved in cell wall biosynthesis